MVAFLPISPDTTGSCRSTSENSTWKLIVKTAIQFSESFEVDGREMYRRACAVGLEIVLSEASRLNGQAARQSHRKSRSSAVKLDLFWRIFAISVAWKLRKY
jgi:hypothetical protein